MNIISPSGCNNITNCSRATVTGLLFESRSLYINGVSFDNQIAPVAGGVVGKDSTSLAALDATDVET